jgi:hypothetical protein
MADEHPRQGPGLVNTPGGVPGTSGRDMIETG